MREHDKITMLVGRLALAALLPSCVAFQIAPARAGHIVLTASPSSGLTSEQLAALTKASRSLDQIGDELRCDAA